MVGEFGAKGISQNPLNMEFSEGNCCREIAMLCLKISFFFQSVFELFCLATNKTGLFEHTDVTCVWKSIGV